MAAPRLGQIYQSGILDQLIQEYLNAYVPPGTSSNVFNRQAAIDALREAFPEITSRNVIAVIKQVQQAVFDVEPGDPGYVDPSARERAIQKEVEDTGIVPGVPPGDCTQSYSVPIIMQRPDGTAQYEFSVPVLIHIKSGATPEEIAEKIAAGANDFFGGSLESYLAEMDDSSEPELTSQYGDCPEEE